MAEYYLRRKIAELKLDYEVRSAGFLMSGVPISRNSYDVLQENGIEAAEHLSTQLSEDVVRKSWLILTMTQSHKLRLIEHFPNAKNKTFTLSEYTGLVGDVADPYGLDIFAYRRTFAEIRERVDRLVEKL